MARPRFARSGFVVFGPFGASPRILPSQVTRASRFPDPYLERLREAKILGERAGPSTGTPACGS
jgi:hypothetical protein